MRFSLMVSFFLCTTLLTGQYRFEGQVGDTYKNHTVYLSLVENYRKSSRVYLDQIIQKTRADSAGYFSFSGNQLSPKNRIYRIHVDGCEEESPTKNHFLRECSTTESLLFIASNADTLSFPLENNNQAFCEIRSTNPASALLLEVEALKEDMILDFMDYDSELSQVLNFKKWFAQFQEFGEESNEPLAELYIYDFLSDRTNETYSTYLEELPSNSYYKALLSRMQNKYPKSKMVTQYVSELQSDLALAPKETTSTSGFDPQYFIYPLFFLVLLSLGYFFLRKRKPPQGKTVLETLTSQERKIMDAILDGKSNKEIAAHFYISVSTVKSHINSIYKKLGLSSRTEIRSAYKANT